MIMDKAWTNECSVQFDTRVQYTLSQQNVQVNFIILFNTFLFMIINSI